MAVYYVRTSGGNDGGDGHDGTSYALGWATVEYANTQMSAGDELRLCKSGVGEEFILSNAVVIGHALDDSIGTIWTGAGSDGTVDGTITNIDASGTAVTDAITVEVSQPSNYIFRNIQVTDAKRDAWRIYDEYNETGQIVFVNCYANNPTGIGFFTTIGIAQTTTPRNIHFVNCSAYSGTYGFRTEGFGTNYYACWSDNNIIGFTSDMNVVGAEGTAGKNMNVANATYSHCIASNNTTGFQYFRSMINCVAYNNSSYGCQTPRAFNQDVVGTQNGIFPIVNCIFEDNGTGIKNNVNADSQPVALINSAFWNNTSNYGASNRVAVEIGTIALSASPFIDASSNDFRLNNITGAGNLCRNAAYPRGTLLDGTHTNWKDIGAISGRKPKIIAAG